MQKKIAERGSVWGTFWKRVARLSSNWSQRAVRHPAMNASAIQTPRSIAETFCYRLTAAIPTERIWSAWWLHREKV